jgi:RNA-directed DNA polymerase
MTGHVFALAMAALDEVNGPEDRPRKQDAPASWESIGWRAHEEQVRRLRQRIFKAAQEGDWPTVRNLQKLMLRSWSNTLVSVRDVTQRNAGRITPGVDGVVALTARDRAQAAARAHQDSQSWNPLPVKRVYIPKANGKQRPLGIPVIMDRCHQARVRNALEPEWEARFEHRSYGFRPGRGCHDAIQALYTVLHGKCKRMWILDADLAAAFDRIDHGFLLAQLGSFPARDMIAGWLKAGVIEKGTGFAPTEEGTPQGGVISPLLLNVALHGLEGAAGHRYRGRPGSTMADNTALDAPVLVRYADDFVACCHTRQQAEQVKARIAAWLAPRGLAFNEDKTKIVHLGEGFDFLGFNVRRYPSGKLLIKPSKPAVKRLRERLAAEIRALRGSNAKAVTAKLNPLIRGWAAYYRIGVSARTFSGLDHYVWQLTYKWAKHTHPRKPKRWIVSRYFGRFCKSRNDRWVYGDRDSGIYLLKFSWTPIVRHTMVKGRASPDDPALARYWATRRRKTRPPLDGYTLRLLTKQDGRCPLCKDPLLSPDQPPQSPQQWETWWLQVTRQAITHDYLVHDGRPGPPGANPTRLVHASCHRGRLARQHQAQHSPSPAALAACLSRVQR